MIKMALAAIKTNSIIYRQFIFAGNVYIEIMNAAHRLHSGSIFGISEWPGKDRVILTIQNDGITCYDTVSNVRASWNMLASKYISHA